MRKQMLAVLLCISLCSTALATTTVTSDVDSYVDVQAGSQETLFTIDGDNYSWSIQRVDHGLTETATVSWEDSQPLGGDNVSGTTDVQWDFWNWGDHEADGDYVEHRLVVTDEDGNQQVFPFYVSYMGEEGFSRVAVESWLTEETGTATKEAEWYRNNTVCSFGPQFRNFTNPITDKWYMFTPVDLSQDGTQVVELVGGSMYVLGRVAVAVQGDQFAVYYRYYSDEVQNLSEFFTIFHDYDSITTVEPEELDSWSFGQVYSISEDLGGDTDVLLYVCNRATFSTAMAGVSRWWKNLPWRMSLRNTMLAHIGMEEEYDYSKQ